MKPVIVGLCAIAAACQDHTRAFTDAEMEELKAEHPGMTEACLGRLRRDGLVAWPARADECFRMQSARHWHGLMGRGFELSRFCPAPASDCDYYSPGETIWMSSSPSAHWPSAVEAVGGVYEVDFIGRRTELPGHFGHQSGYRYEMVVDRVISVKEWTASAK